MKFFFIVSLFFSLFSMTTYGKEEKQSLKPTNKSLLSGVQQSRIYWIEESYDAGNYKYCLFNQDLGSCYKGLSILTGFRNLLNHEHSVLVLYKGYYISRLAHESSSHEETKTPIYTLTSTTPIKIANSFLDAISYINSL